MISMHFIRVRQQKWANQGYIHDGAPANREPKFLGIELKPMLQTRGEQAQAVLLTILFVHDHPHNITSSLVTLRFANPQVVRFRCM